MSPTEHHRTTPAQPQRPQGSLALLIAAAVLVCVVVVLVLLFGVARPPALQTVAEDPAPSPPAAVAWHDPGDGRDACVHVADPDGRSREVLCGDDLGEVVAWDDDGIVLRTYGQRDELLWVDPSTGDEVRRETFAFDRPLDLGADVVTARTRDRQVVVTLDTTGEVLWQTSAPDGYHLQVGPVSADGDWVVLTDAADRLLLLSTDGSAPPRIWSEEGAVWSRPIWEGRPLSS